MIWSTITGGRISLRDRYGLSIDGDGAPIAIKTNDNAKAEKLLNAAGVTTLGIEDLQ